MEAFFGWVNADSDGSALQDSTLQAMQDALEDDDETTMMEKAVLLPHLFPDIACHYDEWSGEWQMKRTRIACIVRRYAAWVFKHNAGFEDEMLGVVTIPEHQRASNSAYGSALPKAAAGWKKDVAARLKSRRVMMAPYENIEHWKGLIHTYRPEWVALLDEILQMDDEWHLPQVLPAARLPPNFRSDEYYTSYAEDMYDEIRNSQSCVKALGFEVLRNTLVLRGRPVQVPVHASEKKT